MLANLAILVNVTNMARFGQIAKLRECDKFIVTTETSSF